jgi:UV DNA damage endonuclease
MSLRLGYACVHTRLPTSARTTRLANATPERLLELTGQNLRALSAILDWNGEHGVEVFRISSGVVPFGGHPVNSTRWDVELDRQLREVGEQIRRHRMQVSMHPGQFVVLGAREEPLVAAALADLEYHARLLRALGLDTTHGIVIHLGGVYADRAAAATRFARAVERLSPDARLRLRLENDERWSFAETLPVAEQLGVPVVLDVFHHELNPSFAGTPVRELAERAGETWRGPQEVHFSTQDGEKRPGAHAQTLDPEAFARFAESVAGLELDCVLEVKDKELSLLKARERLYTGAL